MATNKRLRNRIAFRSGLYLFCRNLSIIILFILAFCIGICASVWMSVIQVIPKERDLRDINPPGPTRIFAVDGTLLGKLYEENREPIELKDMGLAVKATVSIEDIRFYSHPGFDPVGIMRATVKNILSGSTKEGASTITQQLSRNLYLGSEKKLARKVQEIAIALELEKRYSKDEILETYLNQIYYGSNPNSVRSYGIKTAAQTYFSKDPADLTISEAALLAGMPKNPYGYDPYRDPERAKIRRNTVLNSMHHNGFITRKECEEAKNEDLVLRQPPVKLESKLDSPTPYFIDYLVSKELVDIFGKEADHLIYSLGIDVYTTLDPRLQKTADDVVSRQVEANKGRRISEGALITLDAKTAAIKAMVGGVDYKKNQFNVVTQGKRQPGSSFKPIVYTTALLRGYTGRTIVEDTPLTIGRWSPKNSGSYSGMISLRRAVEQSKNVVAVRVAQNIGIENVVKTGRAMGIETELDPYLSTALGASVVTPLELCSAYTVLANDGVYNKPYSVAVIVRGTSVIYEKEPKPERIIPKKVAADMTSILTGAVNRGTGTGARSAFPVAGKTGTTNSYRDAWFVGYTSDLVTAVWVGNRNNSQMNRTFGGTIPAPIWRSYMAVAQPIIADEHRHIEQELIKWSNVKDGTHPSLNTSPSKYIIRNGERRVGNSKKQNTQETNPSSSPSSPSSSSTPDVDESTPPSSSPFGTFRAKDSGNAEN